MSGQRYYQEERSTLFHHIIVRSYFIARNSEKYNPVLVGSPNVVIEGVPEYNVATGV